MKLTPSFKSFTFGLSISLLVLVSFFGGAVADRVFVIKPLDYLFNQQRLPLFTQSGQQTQIGGLGALLAQDGMIDIADISEIASESVVTVSIKKQHQVFDSLNNNPLGSLFGLPGGEGSEQLSEQTQQDIGTGFVVEGNLIVTNKHVLSDPNAEYLVFDKNGSEYKVANIYRDPNNDLAILRVENASLPALPLGDSDQLRVGEGVIAIGTALGEFRHTVTTGVVSGLGRGIEATNGFGFESLEGVIQTDAAINPGNSGGPLIDMNGRAIGVNVAVSARAENIGFAIPINVIKASLDNFNETGQFDRPFLGVQYRVISEQAALFNDVPQGAYLMDVIEGSTAAEAGFQPGDILVEMAGQKLTEEENLASIVNQLKVGERVEIKYWRDQQLQSVLVTMRGQ